MLTIGKLGAGQEGYYLEKVADGAEDYYSGEGEAPGRWSGDGAAELGLEGDVVGDQLRAMLTGHHPATRAADRKRRGLPEPGPRPRLRPHLLRTEVGLAALGPRRPRDLGRGPRRPRALHRRRPRLPPARGLLGPARPRRRRVRPRKRLRSRGLSPSLLSRRRSPTPHPRPDRQRHPGTGRPLDPPLPPCDLRPRQDRRLPLRGRAPPPAHREARRAVAERAEWDRRDRGLQRPPAARILDPAGGDPPRRRRHRREPRRASRPRDRRGHDRGAPEGEEARRAAGGARSAAAPRRPNRCATCSAGGPGSL